MANLESFIQRPSRERRETLLRFHRERRSLWKFYCDLSSYLVWNEKNFAWSCCCLLCKSFRRWFALQKRHVSLDELCHFRGRSCCILQATNKVVVRLTTADGSVHDTKWVEEEEEKFYGINYRIITRMPFKLVVIHELGDASLKIFSPTHFIGIARHFQTDKILGTLHICTQGASLNLWISQRRFTKRCLKEKQTQLDTVRNASPMEPDKAL